MVNPVYFFGECVVLIRYFAIAVGAKPDFHLVILILPPGVVVLLLRCRSHLLHKLKSGFEVLKPKLPI